MIGGAHISRTLRLKGPYTLTGNTDDVLSNLSQLHAAITKQVDTLAERVDTSAIADYQVSVTPQTTSGSVVITVRVPLFENKD